MHRLIVIDLFKPSGTFRPFRNPRSNPIQMRDTLLKRPNKYSICPQHCQGEKNFWHVICRRNSLSFPSHPFKKSKSYQMLQPSNPLSCFKKSGHTSATDDLKYSRRYTSVSVTLPFQITISKSIVRGPYLFPFLIRPICFSNILSDVLS
jgi:hypothetical protein